MQEITNEQDIEDATSLVESEENEEEKIKKMNIKFLAK